MTFEVKGVKWECSGRVRGRRTKSGRCTRLEAELGRRCETPKSSCGEWMGWVE